MSQTEIKKYLSTCLPKGKTVNGNGFLYYKGNHPVLLVAHMDTVHKEKCKLIKYSKGLLSSPQGIGGDDRCGIYMILQLLKKYDCSVLFTEDEEIGCIGARLFCQTDYINKLDVNYMIQLDRRGEKDAVYYSNGNEDFMDYIESFGFERDYGSYSDIAELMPASGIAGVNLSCGYYNEHTLLECVDWKQMMAQIKRIESLLASKTDKWEYEIETTKYVGFFDNNNKYKSFAYDNDVDLLSVMYSYPYICFNDLIFYDSKGGVMDYDGYEEDYYDNYDSEYDYDEYDREYSYDV